MTTRVVIVDDHLLLAQSIALALRAEGLDCAIADLTDRDALLAGIRSDPPDVVLLDLDLGEVLGDGVRLVAPLVASGARVLVLSASSDPGRLTAALDAGAVGALSKTEPVAVLLEGARAAARGDRVTGEGQRRAWATQASQTSAPFDRLSAREGQVLRELASGHSVTAIAAGAHVSEATVRTQVRAVLTKLGVRSQLEAVAEAHRSGWAGLSPSAR